VLAVAAILADRTRRSGPMLRRATSPVLVVAIVQVATFGAYQWSRRSGSVPETVDILGWAWILSLPAVALSFAVGLVNRRLHVAAVLQRLTLRLRAPASCAAISRMPSRIRRCASCTGCRAIRGDGWTRAAGRPGCPSAGPAPR
jgi:hypothetical protein